ncbi:hypothetical protein CPAR01_02474, partial [Colletotrichum paranaense]
ARRPQWSPSNVGLELGIVLLRDSSNESNERARSVTAAQTGLALSSRLLPFLLSVFFLKCPRSHAFAIREIHPRSLLASRFCTGHRAALRRDGGRKRDAAKKKRAGKEGRLHLATQGTVHRGPEDTVTAWNSPSFCTACCRDKEHPHLVARRGASTAQGTFEAMILQYVPTCLYYPQIRPHCRTFDVQISSTLTEHYCHIARAAYQFIAKVIARVLKATSYRNGTSGYYGTTWPEGLRTARAAHFCIPVTPHSDPTEQPHPAGAMQQRLRRIRITKHWALSHLVPSSRATKRR